MSPRRAPWAAVAFATFLACGPGDAPADAPATDAPAATDPEIWLAPLASGEGGLSMGEASNVTRRSGYDNQPAFMADGSVLYTRNEDGSTDIWRYDPASGSHEPVTRTTPESEYSATPLPTGDGISVIRVEADSTQRLWRFNLQGGEPSVVFPDLAPVGYHAWADREHAFLFILGTPATLHRAALGEPGSTLLARDIGRSIQKVPGGEAVSFIQRTGEGTTEIRTWAMGETESRLVTQGFQGGDDHAWTPDGALLQAGGNVLYAFRPGVDSEWVAVGRLPEGTSITRLAVSPDGGTVALVVDTPLEG